MFSPFYGPPSEISPSRNRESRGFRFLCHSQRYYYCYTPYTFCWSRIRLFGRPTLTCLRLLGGTSAKVTCSTTKLERFSFRPFSMREPFVRVSPQNSFSPLHPRPRSPCMWETGLSKIRSSSKTYGTHPESFRPSLSSFASHILLCFCFVPPLLL